MNTFDYITVDDILAYLAQSDEWKTTVGMLTVHAFEHRETGVSIQFQSLDEQSTTDERRKCVEKVAEGEQVDESEILEKLLNLVPPEKNTDTLLAKKLRQQDTGDEFVDALIEEAAKRLDEK